MKCRTKILAALLGILTLASASCGGSEPETAVQETAPIGSVQETEPEEKNVLDKFSELDYEGRDFCFIGRFDYDDELCISEETGEILDDTVYRRNRETEELLDLRLTWQIGDNEYSDFGKTAILAGDTTYDAMMIHSRMAFNFMNDHLLHDWNEDMPYTDLTQSWWSQDMLRNIALGNRIYFMSGDISYYFLADTQVTLFNKRLFEGLNFDDPYQTVRDGKWTFDHMASLARQAARDENGDGVIDMKSDTIGYITTRWRGPNFVYIAEDTRLITLDSDKMPVLSLDLDRAESIYSRYMDFLRSDVSCVAGDVENTDMLLAWTSGKILFFDGLLKYASRMREMDDDFGILPMPKYDETQDCYLSTPGAGINFYAVPASAGDTECSSAVLETLAILGQRDVMPAYYDAALKGKYARDDESAEMLDLIRENIIVDFGALIYSHADNKLNSIGYFLSSSDKEVNFASFYAANVDKFETYLAGVIEMLS